MKNKTIIIGFFTLTFLSSPTHAQEVGGDLALEEGSIRTSEAVIVGKDLRLYATVKNNSGVDLRGTVKFFDETKGIFIDNDQPVSVVANGTDEVFVDWKAESVGDSVITARVTPWDNQGDIEANNKITATIYADLDADGDGIPNKQDPDDDNDGTNDDEDAFPEDPSETADADGDGIGDNADEDDDNDGTTDLKDIFPKDSKETIDTDGDGVGDNADAFPKDADESVDEDGDGIGKNKDKDDNNLGPQPNILMEKSVVRVGASVTFDGSKSKDSDGKVAEYAWDFGKGFEAKGKTTKKEFSKAGNYTVVLKATDDKGESRTTQVTITVIHWWQSLPMLITTIVLVLILGGLALFYVMKKRGKFKKSLPAIIK